MGGRFGGVTWVPCNAGAWADIWGCYLGYMGMRCYLAHPKIGLQQPMGVLQGQLVARAQMSTPGVWVRSWWDTCDLWSSGGLGVVLVGYMQLVVIG